MEYDFAWCHYSIELKLFIDKTGLMRIGTGFDVHKFAKGRKLIIGGVNIPFEKGLLGHSDADVLLHAIMDSFLGAASLGDIGILFPDSDIQYKDANSLELLCRVYELVLQNNFMLGNIDSVVMAEKPKLKPYIPEMRATIAQALDIEINQVSIKATTTEKLGFVGREEGIAANAVVLLLPV